MRKLSCLLLLTVTACTLSPSIVDGPRPLTNDLAAQVENARAAGQAPALGAVTVRCQGEPSIAVSGLARSDRSEPVGPDARFNIGSNAKSMLASLAATYVQDGQLRWTTTVSDILGPEMPTLDPALGRATLAQLLSHRSGLAAFDTGAELSAVTLPSGTPSEQRLAFARQVLSGSPSYPVGERFVYSNAGYVVAGVMLERVGRAPFEQLLRERLFIPMGISAQFGSPVQPATGQPWGHFVRDGMQQPYVDPDPVIPAFLQPAGDVSITLSDYGRYLQEHLCGLEGKTTRILNSETVRALHAPQGAEGAAMGWGTFEMAGHAASVHVGGTGTFAAFVAVIPGTDLCIATVTNSASASARSATLDLLQRLAATR